MNKKASMEIVLLVLLVLLVILVALFNFIIGSKDIQTNIYDSRFIEGVYQKQDLAEFYIRQVGEEVIDKNGESGFKENFKAEFSKYDFAENYLNDLQKIISEGKFDVNVVSNFLEITINSWELKSFAPKGKNIEVSYYPKISLKFDLK